MRAHEPHEVEPIRVVPTRAARSIADDRSAPIQKKADDDASAPLRAVADLRTASTHAANAILQAKGGGDGALDVPAPSGSGSPLPESVRGSMERSFGADFGGVRVHDGPSAESMGGVRAATRGSDITFASGQYDPGSKGGQELIGHELTHVVQQAAGRVQPTAQAKGGAVNTDPGLEAEADRMGSLAAAGKPAPMAGAKALGGARITGPTQFNIFETIRDSVKDKHRRYKQEKQRAKQDKQDRTDQNRIAIDTARDAPADGAATIATAAVTTLTGQLRDFVKAELGGNKELVNSLKTHGVAHIKTTIGDGSQGQKDAQEQAKSVMKASGAHHTAIDGKAVALAGPKATAAQAEILAAAQSGFDDTSGDGDQAGLIAKAKDKAAARANKKAATKAETAKDELREHFETDKAQIETDLKGATATATEAKAHEELDKRTQAEVAIAQAIATPVSDGKTAIEKAVKAFLVDKLGVEGVGSTRSAKLKEFHTRMKAAARAQAKTDVGGQVVGETDELKLDAEKRTNDTAKDSMQAALTTLADTGTTHALTEAKVEDKLKDAASKAAWGSQREQGRGKMAAKTAVQAALAGTQADAITKARAWKNEYVKTQAKIAEAEQAVRTQVTTDKVGENAANESKGKKGDVDLLVNAAVPAGEKAVNAEIVKYLSDEIGAMGAGWWKSDEVKQYRAKLKRAGREQAYQDVDTTIGSNTTLRPATKQYMEVAGKEIAYTKTKGSVNTQMLEFAKTGATQSLNDAGTKANLEKVGRTTAFAGFREKKAKRAIEADLVTAVKGAVATEVSAAKTKADTWKAGLFAGTQIGDAEDKVKEQVGTTDKVGEKSVTQAINANTTAEGMAAVGRICDLAVPNRGDSVKVDVELRIPVPNSPAFVLIRFVGEAERGVTTRKNGAPPGGVDSKSLKVSAQLHIGGGAELWGLRLDGSLGFFVRAQGMDTQKTFQILNYGAYRSACQLGDGIANWWSGTSNAKDNGAPGPGGAPTPGGGGHGKGATERAEMWAAMVEENAFMKPNKHYVPGSTDPKKKNQYIPDPDAFVDIGGLANARGKLKAHVFEGEASIRGELFAHYDGKTIKRAIARAKQKNSINNTSDVGLGKAGTTKQEAKDKRGAVKPKTRGGVVIELKTGFMLLGHKVEFSAKLEAGTGWMIEIGAGLKLDTAGTPGVVETIADGVVSSAASALRSIVGMYQNHNQTGGENATKVVGSIVDIGNDAEAIVDSATGGQLTTALGKALQTTAGKSDQVNQTVSDKWNDIFGSTNDTSPGNAPTKAGTSNEVMLQLLFQFGTGTANLQIKQVKTRKIAASIGSVGIDAQIEKQKRLGQIGMVGGKFHAEGLGFGTSRGK